MIAASAIAESKLREISDLRNNIGIPHGASFADLGHEVILVDNDAKKLAALKNGEVPIHENFLPELLDRHRGGRIKCSGDLVSATQASHADLLP
jgi:UDPglucose 6-dehydrogenase